MFKNIKNPSNILLISEQLTNPLSIKPNSPLAKLNVTPKELIGSDEADIKGLIPLYDSSVPHELAMNTMSEELISIIRARVSFIRNTVTSTIEDILEEARGSLSDDTPVNNRVDIIPVKPPEIYNTEFLLGYVEKFKNATLETVNLPKGTFPRLMESDLLAILSSATSGEVTDLVNQLVNGINVSIVDIYETNFLGNKPMNYPSPMSRVAPSYQTFRQVEAVIVLFLTKGLLENPHEAINMEPNKFTLQMRRKLANTGKIISNQFALLESESNKFYLGVVTTGRVKVLLNSSKYDEFLDSGMTPEHVIGLYQTNAISNGQFSEETLRKALKSYETQDILNRTEQSDRRRNLASRAVATAINQLIDDKEFVLPEGLSKADLITRCRDIMSNYGTVNLERLYYFVREVVCSGLYPESGAKFYLSSMDVYQKENPDLTPRSAATLATRDVICEWLSNQVM